MKTIGKISNATTTVNSGAYGIKAKFHENEYEYPKGHPCRRCPFTFRTSVPSCIFGSYPNVKNCPQSFYKRMNSKGKEV